MQEVCKNHLIQTILLIIKSITKIYYWSKYYVINHLLFPLKILKFKLIKIENIN